MPRGVCALLLAGVALQSCSSSSPPLQIDDDAAVSDVKPAADQVVVDAARPDDAASVDVVARDGASDVVAVRDASGGDVSSTDVSTVDAPSGDAPAVDVPSVDAPSVDASTVDAPSIDAPVADAPAVDAPRVDVPTVDASSVDVSSGDAGADAGTSTSRRFGASRDWPVAPNDLTDGFFVAGSATGVRWWSLLDLNGDGRPDLVQTGDPTRTGGYVFGAGTATPSWRVFLNTGTGFATTATTWRVPDIGLSDGPYTTNAATGVRWWSTFDINGDHRPDLVQTGDPARTGGYVFGAGTATPSWRVFLNTGTGFSTTATTWSLPDIGLGDGPYSTSAATGVRWWSTMDLDGDARPDLVQTGDPARTGGYVFGAGTATPSWRVFLNTGTGFATTATTWRVPDIGLGDGPYSTSAATGVRWWSTMDLDGDARPDLVQTGDPARTGGYVFGAGTATPSWRVFLSTGTGFATTATTWSVPDIGLGDGPYSTSSATGVRWWSTMDLDGDHRPELVQTGDPARTGGYVFGAGTAAMSWRVFPNTGRGFGAVTSWGVPANGLTDGFFETAAAEGVRWWITVDMDGDGRADIAQTGDPARTGGYVFGAGTAAMSWRVFRGE